MVVRCVRKSCGGGAQVPPFELMQYRYDEQPPSEEIRQTMEDARAYWNSVLPSPLPPVDLSGAGGGPAYTQIRVEVTFPVIPNRNGSDILAQAIAFEDFRRNTRVVHGYVEVDSQDVADLQASGHLYDIIRHELFHILTSFRTYPVSGPLCNNSEHRGQNTITEYSALTGFNEAFVPMQPGDCNHWHENTFWTELNTPAPDFAYPARNSRMSIAVLHDLMYPDVNYDAAEPYVLNQPFTASPPAQGIKWRCSSEDGKCVIRKVDN